MICAERINFRNTWLLYCSSWVCPSAELLVLYLQSHILSTSLNKSQFFYSFDNEILKCVPTNPYLSVLIRSQMAHTHQHHQKSQFHSWFHYTTLEGTSETTPRMADIHWYSPPIPSQIYPWVWYPRFHSHADIDQIQCPAACFVWVTITPGNQAASPICSIIIN